MNESFWTVEDLARCLKIKVPTIRYWVHIGYIPHIKFNGAVRFIPEKIMKWVETLERNPVSMMSGKVAGRVLNEHRKEIA